MGNTLWLQPNTLCQKLMKWISYRICRTVEWPWMRGNEGELLSNPFHLIQPAETPDAGYRLANTWLQNLQKEFCSFAKEPCSQRDTHHMPVYTQLLRSVHVQETLLWLLCSSCFFLFEFVVHLCHRHLKACCACVLKFSKNVREDLNLHRLFFLCRMFRIAFDKGWIFCCYRIKEYKVKYQFKCKSLCLLVVGHIVWSFHVPKNPFDIAMASSLLTNS